MGIIPADLYTIGRSTYALEARCSFLTPSRLGEVIASSVGMTAPATGNNQQFVFKAEAEGDVAGFTSIPLRMTRSDKQDEIISTELIFNGYWAGDKQLDEIILTDGTNSITITGDSNLFNANTIYTAVLGGVTTTGRLATFFSHTALYNNCRGPNGYAWARINPRFRVDKDRGELSVWLGDQMKGVAAVDGLKSLGICTWQYKHKPVSNWAHMAYVKEIGVRVEL